eukprot:755459-Hanusia_phi.AAC.1
MGEDHLPCAWVCGGCVEGETRADGGVKHDQAAGGCLRVRTPGQLQVSEEEEEEVEEKEVGKEGMGVG